MNDEHSEDLPVMPPARRSSSHFLRREVPATIKNMYASESHCAQPARRPQEGKSIDSDLSRMSSEAVSLWIRASLSIVRSKPAVLSAIWAFYVLQEVACITLYIVTADMARDEPSWLEHDPAHEPTSSATRFFIGRSVLAASLVLQVPLVSSSWITASVFVATCVYPLTLLFIFAGGRHGVQYYYVPMWLRLHTLKIYGEHALQHLSVMFPQSPLASLLRLFAEQLFQFVVLIASFSFLLRIAENLSGQRISVFESFYLAMVTAATVGYGEISPKSYIGRSVAIVYIFVLMLSLPLAVRSLRQMSDLIRRWASYGGVPNHILLLGNPTYKEALVMLTVAGRWSTNLPLVFVSPEAFHARVRELQRLPLFRHRLVLLEGSISSRSVQRRCRIGDAGLVVITSQKHSVGLDGDLPVLLASRVVAKAVPHIPQLLTLNYHHYNFLHQNTNVIQVHRRMLCKVLLSTAVLQPGIVPFLVNLVHATGDSRVPADIWAAANADDWRSLYKYSRMQRLFEIPGSPLAPLLFMDAAERMGSCGVVLLAVCRDGRVHMKRNMRINSDDTLLVISRLEDDAVQATEQIRKKLDQLCEEEAEEPMSPQSFGHCPNPTNISFSAYPFLRGTSVFSGRVTVEELSFANQAPAGVPLGVLPLENAPMLRQLVDLRLAAVEGVSNDALANDPAINDPSIIEANINELLEELALSHVSAIMDADNTHFDEIRNQNEFFLFIDQRTKVFAHQHLSQHEQDLDQRETENELITMMQCIRSSYRNSTAALLTVAPVKKEFLRRWNTALKFPLRYVKGQASLDRPLDIALSDHAYTVRGIIVFSSQTGLREHGDTPIVSVEMSVTQRLASLKERKHEHYLIVELGSFTGCRFVHPRHSDAEWLRDGDEDYQNCLAFMMGKAFASDMLIPIGVDYYFNRHVVTLFEHLLNVPHYVRSVTRSGSDENSLADDSDAATPRCTPQVRKPSEESTCQFGDREPFQNEGARSTQVPARKCRFKFYGNSSLLLLTFGAAFRLFIHKKQTVLIGVFRRFPDSEKLRDHPRYFITNPPPQALLLPTDILYGVSIKDSS
jgi:voltage-gated potassium channel